MSVTTGLGGQLDETTRVPNGATHRVAPRRRVLLTLAVHPSLRRIGERVELVGLARGVELSRRSPELRTTDGRVTGPLLDPYISRSPLMLRASEAGGVVIDPMGGGAGVLVDATRLTGPVTVTADRLAQGVVLELGGRVVLLLHAVVGGDDPVPKYGLVGESAGIQRVRREITQAAGLPVPVLIRGPSGAGKELVARALHAASPRAARSYVAINLAALNPGTAIADLFGHVRGSFTGALQSRPGYFREADGGTLFLDEIGEASIEVQAMLLRVLESGEIQPIGGAPARRVDVRVIAATDANLDAAIGSGAFRPSLLHRLSGHELVVPSLRDRLDDVPRLLVHFLEHELRRAGQPELFEAMTRDCSRELPPAVMTQLLRHAWPGNVRQLSNVVRRMVGALLAEGDVLGVVEALAAGTGGRTPPAAPTPVPTSTGEPEPGTQVSDAELTAAMRANNWQIAATARQLGVSRNTLYARMKRTGQVRKARDLPRDELAELYSQQGGDLAAMAGLLGVSLRALQLRLRELELVP